VSETPEYACWRSVIARCTNPKSRLWKYYGGRGIGVAPRWLKSANFLADVGQRPSKHHSLDRYPDNDGNYEPGNVRWATPTVQARNIRVPKKSKTGVTGVLFHGGCYYAAITVKSKKYYSKVCNSLEEAAAARKELRAKYNDGDITFEEYEEQSEQLNDKRQDLRDLKFKADLAQESSEQALINHWVSVINPFTAAHPELSEDDVSKSAFDTYLRQTTAPVMNAGGLPGQAEIDKAYAMWCKRFNFTPDGGQQKTTTAKRDIKVPPTLGGLPAASATSVEDGKLAAIQRLSGVEYEEALAKLSPAELEQLSKYA